MRQLLVSAAIGLLGWIGVTTMAWSQDRPISSAQPAQPVVSASAQDPDEAALIALGRRVYREGIGVDGQPLVAVRGGGLEARGEAVACINCHRSSGLGAVEGNIAVSPITGRYLFGQDGRAVVQQNIRGVKAFNQHHAPYDENSVAAAIRAGVHVSGRALDPLMPRFRIDDASMKALLAYLRPLSSGVAPGVSEKQIRLASVITPDVEPARRQLFIDTVTAAVRQKNGSVVHGQRAMSSAAEMLLRTARNWQHEVWELHGAEETWAAQLQAHQARAPVFALVSGLGASRWAPVHRFCEQQALPCWFPSVTQPPPESETDNYSVYFSRGLWLEADVLAQRWHEAGAQAPQRVLQVLGDAADAPVLDSLEAAMAGGSMRFERQVFDAKRAPALLQRLASLGAHDAALLWLRPAQAQALAAAAAAMSGPARSPATAGALIWSGQLLAGQAPPVPASWLVASQVVYPYQLPDQRGASLSYFRQWLQIAHLPLADEVLQSEVFFAMSFLNDVLVDMLDNVQRDYLLDRAESMLTLRETARAEDEAREQSTVAVNRGPRAGLRGVLVERNVATRPLPGRLPKAQPAGELETPAPQQTLQRSEGTTVYPRLSLAPGQRHASRGAYVMRFRPAAVPGQAPQPEALSDWLTP